MAAMAAERIIFDFGANNGDDVAYYLRKADKVVAVEANPQLADQIRTRFAAQIAEGRLFVEACAVTTEASAPAVAFYTHRTNHVLSQFPEPDAASRDQFEKIEVPAVNVVDLVRRHGEPYYVKIDIEYYDQAILRALFENGIVPPYISAESHSIDVFALMVALGDYNAFKLVDGRTVPKKYKRTKIETPEGEAVVSFPEHSAGPFGEDIAGRWMTRNNFFRLLSSKGLGWKDIHASRVDEAHPSYAPVPKVRIEINF